MTSISSCSCACANGTRAKSNKLATRLLALGLLLVAVALVAPQFAFAGQASSGELFFYPCTSCHPVPSGDSSKEATLPNDFEGHKIVLVGHDSLGRDKEACFACHESDKNPDRLLLADGTTVPIKGDTAGVCYRCHSTKFEEWKAGAHGRRGVKCTSAGCHDPHTPGFFYGAGMRPFVGTGFQFQVLSEREAFKPLAGPAPRVPIETPQWLILAATVGLVAAGAQVAVLFRGRPKR